MREFGTTFTANEQGKFLFSSDLFWIKHNNPRKRLVGRKQIHRLALILTTLRLGARFPPRVDVVEVLRVFRVFPPFSQRVRLLVLKKRESVSGPMEVC